MVLPKDQREDEAHPAIQSGSLLPLLEVMQECRDQLKALNARLARFFPEDIRHRDSGLYRDR